MRPVRAKMDENNVFSTFLGEKGEKHGFCASFCQKLAFRRGNSQLFAVFAFFTVVLRDFPRKGELFPTFWGGRARNPVFYGVIDDAPGPGRKSQEDFRGRSVPRLRVI